MSKAGTATDNLIGKLVVEYPTVYVILQDDREQYSINCITTADDVKSTAVPQEERDKAPQKQTSEEQSGDKPQDDKGQDAEQKETSEKKNKVVIIQSETEDTKKSVPSQEEGQNGDVTVSPGSNEKTNGSELSDKE